MRIANGYLLHCYGHEFKIIRLFVIDSWFESIVESEIKKKKRGQCYPKNIFDSILYTEACYIAPVLIYTRASVNLRKAWQCPRSLFVCT